MKDERYFRLKYEDFIKETSSDYKPLAKELKEVKEEFETTLREWNREIGEQSKERLFSDYTDTVIGLRESLWNHKYSTSLKANLGSEEYNSLLFSIAIRIKLYEFFSNYLRDEEGCKKSDLSFASKRLPFIEGYKRMRAIKGQPPPTKEWEDQMREQFKVLSSWGIELAKQLEKIASELKPRYHEIFESVKHHFMKEGKILPPNENDFISWFLRKNARKLDEGGPLPNIQIDDFHLYHLENLESPEIPFESEFGPIDQCLCDFKSDVNDLCKGCPIFSEANKRIAKFKANLNTRQSIFPDSSFKQVLESEMENNRRELTKLERAQEHISDPSRDRFKSNRNLAYTIVCEEIKHLRMILEGRVEERTPAKEDVQPGNFLTFESLFDSMSHFRFVIDLLSERKFIDPHSHIWVDTLKGNKGLLAAIIKDLRVKGYYKIGHQLTNKQIVEICQNSFRWEVGLDTVNRAFPTNFDLSYIPYASTLPE